MKFVAAAVVLVLAAPLAAQTPEEIAAAALEAAPVWDGHNDVPIQLRGRFGNVIGRDMDGGLLFFHSSYQRLEIGDC